MSAIKPNATSRQEAVTNGHENWWEFLQRARKELEAAGAVFRRGVDIAAEIDEIRGEHERGDAVYREMAWQQREEK
jgi:hypothetical protein